DRNKIPLQDPNDTEYIKFLTEINDSYALYELASKQEDFQGIERHISEVCQKIEAYIFVKQTHMKNSTDQYSEEALVWKIRRKLLKRLRGNVIILRECCRRIAFSAEQFRAKEAE